MKNMYTHVLKVHANFFNGICLSYYSSRDDSFDAEICSLKSICIFSGKMKSLEGHSFLSHAMMFSNLCPAYILFNPSSQYISSLKLY